MSINENERLFDQPDPNRTVPDCVQINPVKYSPEELERIASCQMKQGRELCLIKVCEGALKPTVLDLRGTTDYPQDQEERFKRGLINEMGKSLLVLIVKD